METDRLGDGKCSRRPCSFQGRRCRAFFLEDARCFRRPCALPAFLRLALSDFKAGFLFPGAGFAEEDRVAFFFAFFLSMAPYFSIEEFTYQQCKIPAYHPNNRFQHFRAQSSRLCPAMYFNTSSIKQPCSRNTAKRALNIK